MNDFLRSRFKYTPCGSSIHNLNDIKKALYAEKTKGTAYSGAQAYMVRLSKKSHHQPAYDWLAREVFNYINSGKKETQISFDNWHHSICNGFITECAKVGVSIHYGMAQKFVNLLMKYVYCFDDSTSVDPSKFKYCHLPLDGFTYYSPYKSYRKTIPYHSYTILTPFYHRQVNSMPLSKRTVWSKLSYLEYINIQNEIRSYLTATPMTYNDVRHLDPSHLATVAPSYKLTPFETEFFIW